MAKRLFDLILAAALLILTAPVLTIAATLVVFDLGRPVIFVQERAGRGGRPFKLFKLRTMQQQLEGRPLLSDAERVTSLGLLLRRFRIDELPQLLLILSGHMSFVGPRPLYPEGHSRQNEILFRLRHKVRPGLTGWSQVNGNTLLDEREKLALDVFYVSKSTFLFDVWIVWKTLVTLLLGERRREMSIAEALRYADSIDRNS